MIELTPDTIVYLEWRGLSLNATIVFTWVVMALLVIGARIVTWNIADVDSPGRWQNLLEVIVTFINDQIRDITQGSAARFLPFIGTLFLFIAVSNALTVVPGYHAPTGSLSTTAALALCVLLAGPIYGIAARGLGKYLRSYAEPTILMLPFNIIGEITRTLALAVRLYGNVMSGTIIVGILISISPLFFPIVMRLFGLLTGLIQAYIFAVLAMVYIASATHGRDNGGDENGHDNLQSAGEAPASMQ